MAQVEGQGQHDTAAPNAVRVLEQGRVITGEEGGTRGVAVTCIDYKKNPDCEGSHTARY